MDDLEINLQAIGDSYDIHLPTGKWAVFQLDDGWYAGRYGATDSQGDVGPFQTAEQAEQAVRDQH